MENDENCFEKIFQQNYKSQLSFREYVDLTFHSKPFSVSLATQIKSKAFRCLYQINDFVVLIKFSKKVNVSTDLSTNELEPKRERNKLLPLL